MLNLDFYLLIFFLSFFVTAVKLEGSTGFKMSFKIVCGHLGFWTDSNLFFKYEQYLIIFAHFKSFLRILEVRVRTKAITEVNISFVVIWKEIDHPLFIERKYTSY